MGHGRQEEALVYHGGGLGDFVLSLPAVFRVVQAHPGATWRFWGPSDRLSLLPGFAGAPAACRRWGHTLWGGAPEAAVAAVLQAAAVVVGFGGRVPPPWLDRLGGRGIGLGSFPLRGGSWVPVHQGRQLDLLGVPRTGTGWLPAWRRAVLPERLPEAVLLHPGSGDRKKNLPAQTWARAVERVRRGSGLPVRLVLGPVEQERGQWEALGGVVDGVETCQGLADLLAALSRGALLLGNDSGPAHLAALLGVPTAVVFGPSDPALWRPLGPRVRVVRSPLACAPCSEGGAIECAAPACLGAHEDEAVAAAALAILGSR